MTDKHSLPLLSLLADALRRPDSCDPEQLKSLSIGASPPLSAFISALLSTDEDQVQERLAEMAKILASSGNSGDWLDLGRVAQALYFRQASEEYFIKSADLAGEQGDVLTESSAHLALGNLYSDEEDWDRAVQFYKKALSKSEAAGVGKTVPIHEILINMGRACCRQGELSAAQECYSRAMHLLDDSDLAGRIQALYALGQISAEKGDLDGAQQYYERSRSLCQKRLDRRGMASSLAALASIHQMRGESGRVESCLEQARLTLEEMGDDGAAARILIQMADFFFQEGRINEASERYQRGLATLAESDTPLAARASGRLGQCWIDLGQEAEGSSCLSQAAELWQKLADPEEEADLMTMLAASLRRQGRLEEARDCLGRCLELWEDLGNSEASASVCGCLGMIDIDLGGYARAAESFQRAAELFQEQGKSKQEAEALANLASSYHLQGYLNQALDCYSRSLEIFESMGYSQGCSQTLANMGLIHQSQGELSLAEEHLKRSLEERDESDQAGSAGVLISLGITAQLQGDWDASQRYLEQAAKTYEQLGDRSGYSLAQNNLGNLFSDRGDRRRAILCYNKSLDARQDQTDRLGRATTLANLASCYLQERDLEQAERVYRESLNIFKEEADRQGQGRMLLALAGLEGERGDIKSARQRYQECLTIGLEIGDSSGITASLYGLVNVCLRSGRWQEAEGIYGQVLDKLRLSGDEATLAAVLCSWADLKADLGEWEAAVAYYQESLSLLERLGDCYSLAVARNNLANISYRRGDWAAALESYVASREGFEKAGDERSLASVLSNCAALYLKKGEWSQALECYRESLDLFERLEEMAGSAQVLANLGQLYQRRGEVSVAREQFSRALEMYRLLGDREAAAEMQASIDLLEKGGGEGSPNIDECLSQIEQLKEVGDLSGQAELLSLVADYHAEACRWDEALSCYRESLELFTAAGESFNRASILFNMALVHRDRGELNAAKAMLQEAKAIFQEMGAVPCLAQVDLSLGSVLALQGRADDANGHFEQAIERQEALEALPELCESYLTRAQFMAGEGRLVEAEFYLDRGESIISRADCQLLHTLLFLVQGDVHLMRGRALEARSCFEKALSQARSLGNPHQEARALAGMGRAALQEKSYDSAESLLSQALSICKPLGARGDIAAISRILQQLFLSQGDHARAKEMDRLAGRAGGPCDSREEQEAEAATRANQEMGAIKAGTIKGLTRP